MVKKLYQGQGFMHDKFPYYHRDAGRLSTTYSGIRLIEAKSEEEASEKLIKKLDGGG